MLFAATQMYKHHHHAPPIEIKMSTTNNKNYCSPFHFPNPLEKNPAANDYLALNCCCGCASCRSCLLSIYFPSLPPFLLLTSPYLTYPTPSIAYQNPVRTVRFFAMGGAVCPDTGATNAGGGEGEGGWKRLGRGVRMRRGME